MFGTKTTNTRSFSDATNQLIRVHDLTSGEQVVVGRYTKGQNFGGSDVWFRIGKDDTFGFRPPRHHRRAGSTRRSATRSDGSGEPCSAISATIFAETWVYPYPASPVPTPQGPRPRRDALVSCLCRSGK